ncbi:protein FAR-RED IMPAIRED RESPONSE 1 [Euphorbia lathyris]|uniref:protein FAR-RED IMPAIRED RESPONSE 1 n=1 Tax=Euphorbia lathyris TaxID=212925 RepID=UPI003313D6C2
MAMMTGRNQQLVLDMVNLEDTVPDGDTVIENTVHIVDGTQNGDGGVTDFSKRAVAVFEDDRDFEPRNGIEFESHEAAYSFYQEYAKSMGFTTSIKNSRRSKKSKEFIDAKFACSRYGITPESDGSNSRRSSVKKTDCKASMHVKRRPDGKWIIHEFVKEHNHELLPALAYHFRIHRNVKLAEKNNIDILHAVSERTKKMYVEMSRQSGRCQNVAFVRSDVTAQPEKGRSLALDEGDGQLLLEHFKRIKKENPNFFYAIDLNEELRIRNLFWVDPKSRDDYTSFSDVVCFETFYVKYHEKLPYAPFVGVNHHCQPILLGCAFIADESRSTFVWLLKTWLRAMGGQAPKVIVADMDKALKLAIEEVLPNTRHCFSLWHIFEKMQETLSHVIKRRDDFLPEFNKCVFKSWTDDEFDLQWWTMVPRYELQDDEWVQSLYNDRKKWVPTYMGNTFLAGISATQRSESINSFFDKYIHRKMSVKEFMKQYGMILQNRYEEESIADFDTSHKQAAIKSPSPWEKQMSMVYTHTIFKKFQVEVLGVVGCHPKKETEDETNVTFRVQDCEKNEYFLVQWDSTNSTVSCLCRMYEYKGFLCRHALIVLQICGLSSIPSHYILKRWTKDARSRQPAAEGTAGVLSRVQRYNVLCKLAIQMSEEGSVCEDVYNIAFRTLAEALKNCVNANNSNNSAVESGGLSMVQHEVEEENHGNLATKSIKKKNPIRKRKVQSDPDLMIVEAQDSLQQMESLGTDGIPLSSYYGPPQNTQGLVQLNLMEPPHDGYFVNQQSMQGLGQLNSIAPGHDGFFGTQQSMNGLAQFDFRPPTSYSYSLQDDSHLRSSHLHGSASRHA